MSDSNFGVVGRSAAEAELGHVLSGDLAVNHPLNVSESSLCQVFPGL